MLLFRVVEESGLKSEVRAGASTRSMDCDTELARVQLPMTCSEGVRRAAEVSVSCLAVKGYSEVSGRVKNEKWSRTLEPNYAVTVEGYLSFKVAPEDAAVASHQELVPDAGKGRRGRQGSTEHQTP